MELNQFIMQQNKQIDYTSDPAFLYGSYIERILFYKKNNLGKQVYIKTNPLNKNKFQCNELSEIEIIEDESIDLEGFILESK